MSDARPSFFPSKRAIDIAHSLASANRKWRTKQKGPSWTKTSVALIVGNGQAHHMSACLRWRRGAGRRRSVHVRFRRCRAIQSLVDLPSSHPDPLCARVTTFCLASGEQAALYWSLWRSHGGHAPRRFVSCPRFCLAYQIGCARTKFHAKARILDAAPAAEELAKNHSP